MNKMTQITDFCLRCGCDPKSDECCMNNTLLTECKNQRFNCKLQRWKYNQEHKSD